MHKIIKQQEKMYSFYINVLTKTIAYILLIYNESNLNTVMYDNQQKTATLRPNCEIMDRTVTTNSQKLCDNDLVQLYK